MGNSLLHNSHPLDALCGPQSCRGMKKYTNQNGKIKGLHLMHCFGKLSKQQSIIFYLTFICVTYYIFFANISVLK